MPYLTAVDGTEIYYRDWGAGQPVVLIHGWPLDSSMWEKQEIFLAENGLRVITYDRRGFGRSGEPWSGYDYDTLAADLSVLMKKLDLTDATLVGFSMGGGEVVRYLSRFGSERVARAVLLGAVTPCLTKMADNPEGVDPKVFREMEEGLREDRPGYLKGFGQKFYGRTMIAHTVSDATLEWTFNVALKATLHATLASAKAWQTADFRVEMKNITIPVRVIHGTGDVTVPIDAAGRRSVALLPNATLTEYEGAPHGLYLTATERLNDELLKFIRQA